jgi:serine/threonine protein kinase
VVHGDLKPQNCLRCTDNNALRGFTIKLCGAWAGMEEGGWWGRMEQAGQANVCAGQCEHAHTRSMQPVPYLTIVCCLQTAWTHSLYQLQYHTLCTHADFGISRIIHGSRSHTTVSHPPGTLAYFAPELLTSCRWLWRLPLHACSRACQHLLCTCYVVCSGTHFRPVF